jgi:hypothetical protein
MPDPELYFLKEIDESIFGSLSNILRSYEQYKDPVHTLVTRAVAGSRFEDTVDGALDNYGGKRLFMVALAKFLIAQKDNLSFDPPLQPVEPDFLDRMGSRFV